MAGEYEVTISVTRVKAEHVGEALRRLQAAADSLYNEGQDVGITQSVERDHDGVERWHEWIDSEGNVRDIAPWEVQDAKS